MQVPSYNHNIFPAEFATPLLSGNVSINEKGNIVTLFVTLCFFFRRILRSQGLRLQKDVPHLGDFCQLLVPDALYSWPLLPHRWFVFLWHFIDKVSSAFALKWQLVYLLSTVFLRLSTVILHSLSTLLAPEEVKVKHMKFWTMFKSEMFQQF